MKWNVFFKLRGPYGEIEAPSKNNPIECVDMSSLLTIIAPNLPTKVMGVDLLCTGIRIEFVENKNEIS